MSRYSVRVECGHPDCRDVANYDADTRKEQARLYEKYGHGKYRCVRHSHPEEVLATTNLKTVWEAASAEQFYETRSIGLYWRGQGFVHGPGFRAFAKDFPEGTTLRVTAEIILSSGDAKRSGSTNPTGAAP